MKHSTLIYIGCGSNPDVTSLKNLAYRLILIDASKDIAEQLVESYEEDAQVDVINALVAPDGGEYKFFDYTLSWANGMEPVSDEVARLYPGLVCTGTGFVKAVAIGEVLQSVSTPCDALLLLDLDHQNNAILRTLAEPSNESICPKIILLNSRFDVANESVPHDLYIKKQCNYEADIFRSCVELSFDPLLMEERRSLDELKSVDQERSTQLEELQRELAEKEADINQSGGILQRLQQEISDYKEQNTDLHKTLTQRTSERDEERHWHQKHKKWAESLNSHVNELKTELQERTRDVSLGQKMLAKAQLDLDHLRDSYAQKVISEKELVELVTALREKLTSASEYYYKFQQEHPELLMENNSCAED